MSNSDFPRKPSNEFKIITPVYVCGKTKFTRNTTFKNTSNYLSAQINHVRIKQVIIILFFIMRRKCFFKKFTQTGPVVQLQYAW